MRGRSEALRACAESGVGVVAMKPFAGGKLLQRRKRAKIPKYQTGGITVEVKVPAAITPAKCLKFILS